MHIWLKRHDPKREDEILLRTVKTKNEFYSLTVKRGENNYKMRAHQQNCTILFWIGPFVTKILICLINKNFNWWGIEKKFNRNDHHQIDFRGQIANTRKFTQQIFWENSYTILYISFSHKFVRSMPFHLISSLPL